MTFPEAWLLYAPSDLPKPRPHYQFDRDLNCHLDWAFIDPRCMLAIELNRNLNQERTKYNAAAAKGWRMIYLTPEELDTNPQKCVDLTVKALGML
jgi:hypothetical protein